MLPIIIVLPIVFLLIVFNVITISFGKLGLSPEGALTLLFATLIGSIINIPISRRRIAYEQPVPAYFHFFFYLPPRVRHQVVAINVGGALIPVAYISGTMGTLIGADLLNWPSFKKLGSHLISIGGAGVFDGIFLSGVIAALIA
ncbi:MAG: DUF1614 domain-containing protein [Chloroflexota bacterium]